MLGKKIILSIAIALIFALFVGYGIELIDETPKYRSEVAFNEPDCSELGGKWEEESRLYYPEKPEVTGYCDFSAPYQEASAKHNKLVFIIAMIAGLIAVTIGVILKKEAISNGILGGGVITILYGTIRYWQHASNNLKFILLGIALAVLLYLSYKKIDKK